MRIIVGAIPPGLETHESRVGDVFKMRGGPHRDRFHAIMAISASGQTAYCLCFDNDGNITGCTQYGMHYMDRKERVGFIEVPDLSVTWCGP